MEAWQVPNDRTLQSLLAARVAGRGRVYGIGFSGSPLSQYLAYADMARKEFAPDGMAFVIVGNDFDESLLKYKQEPGYHYFAERERRARARTDRSPGQSWRWRSPASRASRCTCRYTVGINLRRVIASFVGRRTARPFVGNVAAEASAERIADSDAGHRRISRELPARSGLLPENILFIVDAIRPQLYTPGELARGRELLLRPDASSLHRAGEGRGFRGRST